MKKYLIVFTCIMMLSVAVPSSAYYYYDFKHVLDNGGYSSPYSNIVETFDDSGSSNLGWTLSGNNYAIRNGSIEQAAAPWWDNGDGGARDATYYLTVPESLQAQPLSVTIDFNSSDPYNYFGLWWGSMDTWNTLEFLAEDRATVVATVSGTTFSSGDGNQNSAETNKYVNFYGMGDFYAIKLTSTNYAFEVDNLAVGYNVVPEPATMLTLGLALLGLAGLKRKFEL